MTQVTAIISARSTLAIAISSVIRFFFALFIDE